MASPEQLARLHAVVPAAQAARTKWGVPASVTLAQWILESTWGTSQLALKCNNFFGIKAHHLAAPDTYEEFPTAEYEAGKRVMVEALFEKYADPAGSFDDHGRLLATAARYKRAMAHASQPVMFAVCLQLGGYSTSASYAPKLRELMVDYDLYQYDTPPPAAAVLQPKTQEAA